MESYHTLNATSNATVDTASNDGRRLYLSTLLLNDDGVNIQTIFADVDISETLITRSPADESEAATSTSGLLLIDVISPSIDDSAALTNDETTSGEAPRVINIPIWLINWSTVEDAIAPDTITMVASSSASSSALISETGAGSESSATASNGKVTVTKSDRAYQTGGTSSSASASGIAGSTGVEANAIANAPAIDNPQPVEPDSLLGGAAGLVFPGHYGLHSIQPLMLAHDLLLTPHHSNNSMQFDLSFDVLIAAERLKPLFQNVDLSDSSEHGRGNWDSDVIDLTFTGSFSLEYLGHLVVGEGAIFSQKDQILAANIEANIPV